MYGLAEKSFAVFSLYFFMGGLHALLTPRSLDGTGLVDSSPAVRAIGLLVGALPFAFLLFKRGAIDRMFRLYWPVLLPVGFAVLSAVWSIDPGLTIRRAGSLVLTTAFAIWLAERFSMREITNLVLAAFFVLCVLSYVAIIVVPQFGIHQPGDTTSDHAGAWRGMIGFKNDFGRVIALGVVCFFSALMVRERFRTFYWVMVGLLAILILGSTSAQAIVLSVVPVGVLILARALAGASPKTRAFVLAIAVPLSICAYFIVGLIVSYALSLLGRDMSLTGRTDIWGAVMRAIGGHFLLGGGFGSGWAMVEEELILERGRAPGHAHNGYLDTLVDVGIVGVILTLLVVLPILVRSFRNVVLQQRMELGFLGLGYSVFYLVGNVAGSFVLLHNSIYWVFVVFLYCKLATSARTVAARQLPPEPFVDPTTVRTAGENYRPGT